MKLTIACVIAAFIVLTFGSLWWCLSLVLLLIALVHEVASRLEIL